jgi:hypothetical protein
VEVADMVRGERWSIPVRSFREAWAIRDRIVDLASRMSDVQLDVWSRLGRWTSM